MKTHVTAEEIGNALGVSRQAVQKRAKKEQWREEQIPNRKGRALWFPIDRLPSEIQIRVITHLPDLPSDLVPRLCPEAAVIAAQRLSRADDGAGGLVPSFGGNGTLKGWTDETALSPKVLGDKRVSRIMAVLRDADNMPADWSKGARAWMEAVAAKHGVAFQSIYKWRKQYADGGMGGLVHTKVTRGKARAWDDGALDWWVGLCLKRENRKRSRKWLYYNVLVVEAHRQGWRIGSERSALDYAKQRITPALEALQKGGRRALDNALPPVLRDYSDLEPFQIIVGDQHRFDFWVTDETTGNVFRPEGYFWMDLRTRLWYGAAISDKYDSFLMGQALHIGCQAWGPFGTLYNDNGKPEQSRYIMGIQRDMSALGFQHDRTVDGLFDLEGSAEEVNPAIRQGQRFAIVRNAKAKMIEGAFDKLEAQLRDAGVPGYVHELGGPGEENEVDDKELAWLAQSGRLLTYWEFVLAVYRCLDHYNRRRGHRGVLKEWAWRPKPKPTEATPIACLGECIKHGWRRRHVDQAALDLLFLPRWHRQPTVIKGRIQVNNEVYEHVPLDGALSRLIPLNGQKVEVRYDPYDWSSLIVFYKGEYVCRADAAEKGSMIDPKKTARLIARKRGMAKDQVAEFRRLTSGVPDTRIYSEVSPMEKAAALMGRDKQKRAAENDEKYRVKSDEEIAAGVARIEDYHPERRRPTFSSESDRYRWCLDQAAEGFELEKADLGFMAAFEDGFTAETREYWEIYRGSIGIKTAIGSDR